MNIITDFFNYLTSFFSQDNIGQAVWRSETVPDPELIRGLDGLLTDWSIEEVPYVPEKTTPGKRA